MRLKLDFSLPKLVRLRFGVQVGLDVGVKVDVRWRLRGREPVKWKAALLRADAATKKKEEAGRELADGAAGSRSLSRDPYRA
ncbi:MAG: hypothetical protein JWN44_3574 [Myxococcales bacterium]|nr:hypothetical protein [Myxococcales bacterium]